MKDVKDVMDKAITNVKDAINLSRDHHTRRGIMVWHILTYKAL